MAPQDPPLQAIANLLLDALNAAQVPHGRALDVLLSLYHALALKFPCCTPSAAVSCQVIAIELAAAAAAAAAAGTAVPHQHTSTHTH